eukprot:TRINITY_DN4544_c0_g2_i1.p1 TRINITY_DN4544_c0_g2~~TRINITY_DN4544_c0_g2_i1.p1  ORF type:complete len:363 (-),score=74.28 TRINITY_DN4544_c0_g2_i1:1080-2168(-)
MAHLFSPSELPGRFQTRERSDSADVDGDGGADVVAALRLATLPDANVCTKVKVQRDAHGRVNVTIHNPGDLLAEDERTELPMEVQQSVGPANVSRQHGVVYQLGGSIGRGSFGTVHRALNIATGALLAVKRVYFRGDAVQRQALEIAREIGILQVLRHANIVGFIGCEPSGGALDILMEFVPGGSVASLIQQMGPLPEMVMRRYTESILRGLVYLHDNGILHRDVKAANCLVCCEGSVKLADFGCAKSLEAMCTVAEGMPTVCGTPTHMAPEVIKQKGVGRRADVYSVGCTVIEMATGRAPFTNMHDAAAVMYLVAIGRATPEIPAVLSPLGQDFVRKCLIHNPRERPTATQLLAHEWVAGF